MKKPKNKLQALLAARGMSTGELAKLTGYNYHTVQKELTGARKTRHVDKAIADAMGLDLRQLQGSHADRYLSGQIQKELDRIQKEMARRNVAELNRLRERYLGEAGAVKHQGRLHDGPANAQ